MIKIKFKNIDKVKENVIKTFDSVRKDTGMLLEVANTYAEYVKFKTRAGNSLADNNKLPKLESNSVKGREYLAKYNPTHETYKSGRSNLTITGQLIDSIKPTKIDSENSTVVVSVTGIRTPYKNSEGKPIKGQELSNSKIYEYLKEKGFRIFGKDQAITKRINNIVKRIMRREISKGLGK